MFDPAPVVGTQYFKSQDWINLLSGRRVARAIDPIKGHMQQYQTSYFTIVYA